MLIKNSFISNSKFQKVFTNTKPFIKYTLLSAAKLPIIKQLLSRWQGPCAIFCLHRVLPDKQFELENNPLKNLALPISSFTDLLHYLNDKYCVLSMDDLVKHLHGNINEQAVCITFDDGYKDNLTHALPILEEYKTPATIYITTQFPEGDTRIWWHEIWDIIENNARLNIDSNGEKFYSDRNHRDKVRSFHNLRYLLHNMTVKKQSKFLEYFLGKDIRNTYSDLLLNWDEIKHLDNNNLITIGSHTHSHANLVRESFESVQNEMLYSKNLLEEKLNHDVFHLAYPFGTKKEVGSRELMLAKEIGYTTAVTTQCYPANKSELHCLPRYSVVDKKLIDNIEPRLGGLCNALNLEIT